MSGDPTRGPFFDWTSHDRTDVTLCLDTCSSITMAVGPETGSSPSLLVEAASPLLISLCIRTQTVMSDLQYYNCPVLLDEEHPV